MFQSSYRSVIERYNHCEHFTALCDKISAAPGRMQVDRLKFYGKLYLGTDEKNIITGLGKPPVTFDEQNESLVKIHFYKKMVNNYRVKIQTHIKDRRFVLGVLTFDYLSKAQKEEILRSISLSYNLSNWTKESVIEDGQGNLLLVIDDFYFDIVYLNRAYLETRQAIRAMKKEIAEMQPLPFF